MGLIALAAGAVVWAQVVDPGCPVGECVEATRWGGWGLVALGLAFFAIWLMPAGTEGEGEAQDGWTRLPFLGTLQRRFERERTGWRRFQWPVLGAFFVALGLAYVLGWR